MRRPLAVAIAALMSAIFVAGAVLAGAVYASGRRGEDAIVRRALATLRREARAPRAPAANPSDRLRVCPEGAEGLAATARRALGTPLVTEGSRLIDPAALAAVSNLAIASGRYLERARAAPALPQRLGRQRTAGGWEPLEPEPIGCAAVAAGPPAPAAAR